MSDATLITVDVDWAPDFVIDFMAHILIERRVRATWFITHNSPAVDRLRHRPDLFELGIHPNFLPGSTHGDTREEVLHYCMNLVPEAVSMRTHSLFQSTLLLEHVMKQTPITTDVSLFMPHTPGLCPVAYPYKGHTLLRIPYYWEDDFEMKWAKPNWHLASLLATGAGLKVFDFHPIHVYLNSSDIEPYQALVRASPRLTEATPANVEAYVNAATGTRTLFTELVEYLATTGQSLCVRNVHKQWQQRTLAKSVLCKTKTS